MDRNAEDPVPAIDHMSSNDKKSNTCSKALVGNSVKCIILFLITKQFLCGTLPKIQTDKGFGKKVTTKLSVTGVETRIFSFLKIATGI